MNAAFSTGASLMGSGRGERNERRDVGVTFGHKRSTGRGYAAPGVL